MVHSDGITVKKTESGSAIAECFDGAIKRGAGRFEGAEQSSHSISQI